MSISLMFTFLLFGLSFSCLCMDPKGQVSRSQALFKERGLFNLGKELTQLLNDSNFWKITIANAILIAGLNAFYITLESVNYAYTMTGPNFFICYVLPYIIMVGVILFVLFVSPQTHIKLLSRFSMVIAISKSTFMTHCFIVIFIYCFETWALNKDNLLTSYVIFKLLTGVVYGGILIGVYELQAEVTFPQRITLGFAIFNTIVSTFTFFLQESYVSYITSLGNNQDFHNPIPAVGFLTVLFTVIPIVIYLRGGPFKLARLDFEG